MEKNPYSTPQSNLANDVPLAANNSGMFSFSGRIGRLRYLAYLMLMYLIVAVAAGIPAAILVPMMGEGEMDVASMIMLVVMGLLYLLLIVYAFVYAVRRLNDCGHTGWFSLLFFIPLVNLILSLYLLFAPGNQGANAYGSPAAPNHAGIYIAAIAPVFLIAILAAIALPAYQDYVQRAQQAQIMQQN